MERITQLATTPVTRTLAETALALRPPDSAGIVTAQVVHGWALVGLGAHTAAIGPRRAAQDQGGNEQGDDAQSTCHATRS